MDLLLVLISSTLTTLAMPGFLSEFFIWFSLIFLLRAMDGKGILKSILLSYIYGLFLLMMTCFWQLPTLAVEIPKILGRYGTIGGILAFILAATVIGAPPYAIFGFLMGLWNRMKLERYIPHPFYVASSYTLMEFMRGLGTLGFTGAMLSDSLYRNVGLMQLVAMTGSLGLVFLIALVNSIIFSIWKRVGRIHDKLIMGMLIVGSIYTVSIIVSSLIPLPTFHRFSDSVRVIAFQMNLSQKVKYSSGMTEQVDRVLQMMEDARKRYGSLPDLYVFPEAVFFDDLDFYEYLKEELMKEVDRFDSPVIVGGMVRKNGKHNSALFIKDEKIEHYSKIKLTPFAEILPFPKFFGNFSFLRLLDYYAPGKEYKVFELKNARFSVQICFESFFPQVSRNFVKNGAQFLVIITNDGWFRYRTALIQHFSKAVFRAVENGKYVLQVANTGITGLVDPHGRIVKILLPETEEMGLFELIPNSRITPYTRFGDSIVVIPSLIILIFPILRTIRIERKGRYTG